MSWNKGVNANNWAVYTETISLNTAATDQSSSVIDFIPYGKDFHVIMTPDATLATTCPVDIDMCDSSTGTFWELCTTSLSLAAGAAAATRDLIDNSAKGQAPYYKLRIDKPAAIKTATGGNVVVKVLVPLKNGIVY